MSQRGRLTHFGTALNLDAKSIWQNDLMPTSTGRAAARLHVAQPPVSRMMRQLERDLGVDPFIRSTRTVQLTAAGVALTASAREILAAADRARASAIAAGRGAVTLPVSASTTVHGWASG